MFPNTATKDVSRDFHALHLVRFALLSRHQKYFWLRWSHFLEGHAEDGTGLGVEGHVFAHAHAVLRINHQAVLLHLQIDITNAER